MCFFIFSFVLYSTVSIYFLSFLQQTFILQYPLWSQSSLITFNNKKSRFFILFYFLSPLLLHIWFSDQMLSFCLLIYLQSFFNIWNIVSSLIFSFINFLILLFLTLFILWHFFIIIFLIKIFWLTFFILNSWSRKQSL